MPQPVIAVPGEFGLNHRRSVEIKVGVLAVTEVKTKLVSFLEDV